MPRNKKSEAIPPSEPLPSEPAETVSMTEAQLAVFDDDGGPPVSIPDVGAGADVEGCPTSSGWRTRIAHTSLSPVPVMITTWEPYA